MNDRAHEGRLPLTPGTVIEGRYRIERTLGIGGMGAVVAATDLDGDGLVAIKFLLPQCAGDEQLLARFDREARATVRLRGEHVRRVLGSGVIDERTRYLVMEYLDGEDLRALVKREGPLDPRRAADYVSQAGRALAEAHALGIVHRDLKPANLFLARQADGREIIKVVDFGVAKFDSPNVAGDKLDVTGADLVLGSRHFMAPEQVLSPRGVDALADVWALGAILHYLLAGQAPFVADSIEETTLNLLTQPPHPLPGCPERLVQVAQRCLEKDRAQRYRNVIELVRALAPFTRRSLDSEPPRSARADLLRTMDFPPIDPSAFIPPEQRAHASRPPVVRAPAPLRVRTRPPQRRLTAQDALTIAAAFVFGVILTVAATGAAARRIEPARAPASAAQAALLSAIEPAHREPAPAPSAEPAAREGEREREDLPSHAEPASLAPRPLVPRRAAPAAIASATPPPSVSAVAAAPPPATSVRATTRALFGVEE